MQLGQPVSYLFQINVSQWTPKTTNLEPALPDDQKETWVLGKAGCLTSVVRRSCPPVWFQRPKFVRTSCSNKYSVPNLPAGMWSDWRVSIERLGQGDIIKANRVLPRYVVRPSGIGFISSRASRVCCDRFLPTDTQLSHKSPTFLVVPAGSPSRGGDVTVCVWHKSTQLAYSILFCSCVCFCLYSPFNCISFNQFSRQHSLLSVSYTHLTLPTRRTV